jgi:Cdc6-like AAA superfamily ATPase
MVTRFVERLAPALRALGNRVPALRADRLEDDVVLEAFDLSAAFVDSDGVHTDNELWELITTFGPLLETSLGHATPADVRKAGVVNARRAWLERPSMLFEVLLRADQRDRTTHAWAYYEEAMALAHAVCSIDAHTSHLELRALDGYRSVLVKALKDAGVARPGSLSTAEPAGGPAAAPVAESVDALPPARPLEELYEELDGLVGLDAVKAEVRLVADLIQVQNLRQARGLPVPETSRHLVFTGNPGTGKTTVARLLAQIYRTLGAVSKGHLVETDRSGLVAGYVGQTAIKVREVFESALGGVLLIDEAYALARGTERDFGIEAIDTLVKLVEDHRDEVVVIVAGYPDEMEQFVASNPGLRSRLPRTIHFPDYTTHELVAIFESLCERHHYRCDDGARAAVRQRFDEDPRGKGFGNGRLARNLFERAIAVQASRIVAGTRPADGEADASEPSDEELVTLTAADVVD